MRASVCVGNAKHALLPVISRVAKLASARAWLLLTWLAGAAIGLNVVAAKGFWSLACLATLVACEGLINADFDKADRGHTGSASGQAGADGGRTSEEAGSGGEAQGSSGTKHSAGGSSNTQSPAKGGGGSGNRASEGGSQTGDGGSRAGEGGEPASDGGMRNSGGDSGAAGEASSYNPDWDMPAVVPFCHTYPGFSEALDLHESASVGVLARVPSERLSIVATVPADQVVGVRWMTGNAPPWVDWSCFDALSAPARAAGIAEEAFVTTQQGSLFNRFQGVDKNWTQWQLFKRPTTSALVRDIATARSDARPGDVLLATSEGLYWAERLGFDVNRGYEYSSWKRLNSSVFERVALCGDQPVRAFALASKQLFEVDLVSGQASLLEPAQAERLVDVDCTGASGPATLIYGVSADGALLGWPRSGLGVTGATLVLKPAAQDPSLVSVSTALRPARDFIFAIDQLGHVLMSSDGGGTWSTDNWAIE